MSEEAPARTLDEEALAPTLDYLCLHEWSDGWGDHLCTGPPDHDDPHRCRCDITEGSFLQASDG